MTKAYIECIKVAFKSHTVFRAESATTILNSILSIVVGVSIWRAIYADAPSIGNISIGDLTSYMVIAFSLQAGFAMDEFILDKKIKTGSLASDLVKPLDMRSALFYQHVGSLLFKVATQILPVGLAAFLFFDFRIPTSPAVAAGFLASCILGYLVLYNLNQIFWSLSFWIHVTWSVITIKDALLMLFSGILFPLWFMPQPIRYAMKFTPFESIYYWPISIYTGKTVAAEIGKTLLVQVIWAVLLYLLGRYLWSRGLERVSIQGG